MNPNEAGRLAHAVNDLRPDWPISSLRTFIERTMLGRTYRDAAVALAWVATDTRADGSHASETPKRVLEAGPWWRAATIENPASLRPTPPKRADQCSRCGGQLPGCSCTREHLAATYDEQEAEVRERMDRETAAKAARDAIHAAKAHRPGEVGTGAGGVDDPITEATSRVNRSADCPEAPAQAHLPAQRDAATEEDA